MVLLRMVFQPGPNELIDLELGIFIALIGAAIVAYGGWQSMKEEGTTFDDARRQLRARYGQSPSGEATRSDPVARPYTGDAGGAAQPGESEPPPP
jgi:hypothetical protein